MKPTKLACALAPILSATLLAACGTAARMPDKAWTVDPVLAVAHGKLDAHGYYTLGRHAENRPPPERALEAYRKAVDLDPAYVPAWNALGTLQARLGQLEEALRAFERAVRLSPAAGHLHNNLGYALLLAGRDEAAVESLRRAVEIDADDRRAWRNLADAYRRLGDSEGAEDAEAKASGTWVGKIRTPTEGARAVPVRLDAPPQPITVESAGLERALPMEIAAEGARAPAPSTTTAAIQASTARLVKLADNVYALRGALTASPIAMSSAAEPPSALLADSAPAPSRAGDPIRYEVSNGHGRDGLARRIATHLHDQGLAFARLTNQRPFNEPASIVQYREGFRDAAESLVAHLPFQPAIATAPSANLVADVRLLLGRDLSVSAACIELDLCARVATSKTPTTVADAGSHEQPYK